MNARHTSFGRPPGAPLLAALAAIALVGSSLLAPAAAGGLGDFLKKGSKGGKSESSPSKSEGSSDRDRPSSERDSGDSSSSLWNKRKPDKPAEENRTDPPRASGLFDVFNKRESSSRPPASRPDAGGLFRPGVRPGASGSGGLFSVFDKPGRPQPYRPQQPATAPPIVVYHFYDPWYYPYDRFFYTHYYPHVRGHYGSSYYGIYLDPYPRHDESRYGETAAQALRDIERGWEERKWSYIGRHVDDDQPISVYHDGEFSHTMMPREFRVLTLQAFEDVRTVRFRFYTTPESGRRDLTAQGEHVFVGPDGDERRVELSYTLRKVDDGWYIRSIDLREQKRTVSLDPVVPTIEAPTVAFASLDLPIADEDFAPVAGLAGSGARALAEPPLTDPYPRLAFGRDSVDVASHTARRVRVAAVASPSAVSPAGGHTETWRVVCTSTPLKLAAVRAARRSTEVATITYLRPAGRATYYVHLAPARDGIAWSLYHRGETRVAESGTIPEGKLKALGAGEVRVVVSRVAAPGEAGEQRFPLVVRSGWDLQIALAASPKVVSRAPARTEVLISSRDV